MTAGLDALLLVFTGYAIAAGSPGPSNLRIMAIAMSHGRRPALTLAAGVVAGSLCWGLVAATGLSALLTRSAGALILLKVLGGAYLLYLAVRAAGSALKGDTFAAGEATAVEIPSPAPLFRKGLWMHLSNPKAVLSWVALMTLGLGPNASWQTVAVILGGCAVLSIVIFCGYALAFSTRPAVRFYRRARRWIEGTLALFFGYAGLRLLAFRI